MPEDGYESGKEEIIFTVVGKCLERIKEDVMENVMSLCPRKIDKIRHM